MKYIILIITAVMFWAPGLQASSISFNSLNSTVDLNDTFTIDIIGTDFLETQGGGVNLFFNENVIEVLSVDIDPGVWNFVNDEGTIENLLGTVSDILVSAINPGDTDPMGNFIVATIEFKAIGIGFSDLSMTESQINPWATNGELIDPDFILGSVTIVPLPATLWLFSAGLISFIGIGARRNKRL